MFLQVGERRVDGQLLERQTIGMKTEITCQRDIQCMLPTAFGDLEQSHDRGAFAFEAFAQQGLAPTIGEQMRIMDQLFCAADTVKSTVYLLRGFA